MGFQEYFLAQAELADDLYDRGCRINCYTCATAAIDRVDRILDPWKELWDLRLKREPRVAPRFRPRLPSTKSWASA